MAWVADAFIRVIAGCAIVYCPIAIPPRMACARVVSCSDVIARCIKWVAVILLIKAHVNCDITPFADVRVPGASPNIYNDNTVARPVAQRLVTRRRVETRTAVAFVDIVIAVATVLCQFPRVVDGAFFSVLWDVVVVALPVCITIDACTSIRINRYTVVNRGIHCVSIDANAGGYGVGAGCPISARVRCTFIDVILTRVI